MTHHGIDCPSCHREIAREYGDWLDALRNCPFCAAPLELIYDPENEGEDELYFVTEEPWL